MLGKFEVSQKFGEIPNFLKHADRDPEYVLNACSRLSVHLTLAFAIRLWEEHGREKNPLHGRLFRVRRSIQARASGQ